MVFDPRFRSRTAELFSGRDDPDAAWNGQFAVVIEVSIGVLLVVKSKHVAKLVNDEVFERLFVTSGQGTGRILRCPDNYAPHAAILFGRRLLMQPDSGPARKVAIPGALKVFAYQSSLSHRFTSTRARA